MVIIDTSVWSLALRRPKKREEPRTAETMIRRIVFAGESIVLPGIVLQELLSGIRSETEFERLRSFLQPFRVNCATEEHHVEAAIIFNRCRKSGIATTAPDALIAATTRIENGKLLSADRDFVHLSRVVDLELELVDI